MHVNTSGYAPTINVAEPWEVALKFKVKMLCLYDDKYYWIQIHFCPGIIIKHVLLHGSCNILILSHMTVHLNFVYDLITMK